MRRTPLLAGLVAVALFVAGCTGAPAAPPAEPGPTAGPAERPVSAEPPPTAPPDDGALFVFPIMGKLTAAASAGDVYYANPTAAVDAHDFIFVVEPGAAWFTAELTWAEPLNDFDLELAPPGCDLSTGQGTCIFLDGGAPGAGDSPVRFNVTDPALLNLTGTWHAIVWAKLAVNGYYAGAIAVFYPPAGEAAAAAGERA